MKTNFTNAYDKEKNTFLKRIPPLSTNFLTKQPKQNRRILENVTNNNLKKNNRRHWIVFKWEASKVAEVCDGRSKIKYTEIEEEIIKTEMKIL